MILIQQVIILTSTKTPRTVIIMLSVQVSYISNSRVTDADADDWMALPLIGENEVLGKYNDISVSFSERQDGLKI